MTNEEFLTRYDSGKPKFTEAEIKKMAYGFIGFHVDTIEYESHRWYQEVETIFEVNGRYFGISWDRGATEMQENEFDMSEVYEVVKKEVVTFEWVCKEDKKND